MSLSLSRQIAIRISRRTFSTTATRPIKLQLKESSDPTDTIQDVVPAYPYGPKLWYKTADKGLYGGKRLRFGNNVGKKIETKTRRRFALNVARKQLFSNALQRMVQLNVTTRVLRTIDKVGGLDEYLLGEKEARIKELGMSGWWLRWAIMNTPDIQARYAAQRAELGIPQPETEHVELLTPISQRGPEDEVIEEEVDGLEETAAAVSEAEGASAAAATEAEVEAEEVFTDDAFRLDSAGGQPPLTFRVGGDQIIELDSMGWRRGRELREKREQAERAAAFRKKAMNHVDEYMRLYEAYLDSANLTTQRGLPINKEKALEKARQQYFRSADRWPDLEAPELAQRARRRAEKDAAVAAQISQPPYITDMQDLAQVSEVEEIPATDELTGNRHAQSSLP